MNLPEYAWAQLLQVALYSLRLAFDNVSGYEPISIEKAAEQLDSIRRSHRLTMIPPSDYYFGQLSDAPQSAGECSNGGVWLEKGR